MHILFLPNLDLFVFILLVTSCQEQSFLQCAVETMGGTILPFLDTLESSLAFYVSRGLTHIVTPSLTPSQRDRITRTLQDSSVAIRSSTWLYTCIDSRCCIALASANLWQASLFLPAPR